MESRFSGGGVMVQSDMTTERKKSLAKLAALMNTRHRLPFPITRPLLDCFDIALTPAEADFCLRLGTEPFACEEVTQRSGLAKESAEPLFRELLRKGFFWPQPAAGDKEVYALSGIMLGWFEAFLSDGTDTPQKREFARRLDALIRSWGRMNRFPLRALLNYRLKSSRPSQSILAVEEPGRTFAGTIAVNRPIEARPMKIYPAQTVLELIEKHGDADSIALVHCFCRHYRKLVGDTCRFEMPSESCMAIGHLARHAARHGAGRSVSKEEATALIRELDRKGAVHQVFHEGEDPDNPEIAICNCCWDCCGVFGSYNRGYLPLQFRSFFEARVADSSLCNGCGVCEDHCPVRAVTLVADKAQILRDQCIGCGQCRLQCPQGAVELVPHERRVFLPLTRKAGARI